MDLDFVKINEKLARNSVVIEPTFLITNSNDLMIRGHSFYAIYDDRTKLWSKQELDAVKMIDDIVYKYVDKNNLKDYQLNLLSNFSSYKMTEWQKYCKSMPDMYHDLDSKIIFSNTEIKKRDYATFSLDYPIEEMETPAYNKMMSVLYKPSERIKIEWAIGSVIAGDSKNIQKMFVFYGGPGTGKSTVLNLIQNMFPGYCSTFESKELAKNDSFGLESLNQNPLIAIEHDGDLSRIEDNTKLNSIVSHEKMIMNEKHKSKYEIKFRSLLFMGTNKPVLITDLKSGLLRRLIDIIPTGNRIERDEYERIIDSLKFEYPGIAYKCLETYKKLGYSYYDGYKPEGMMSRTNDFYNFVEDNYEFFSKDEDGILLSTAWRLYKVYCEETNMKYVMNRRVFRDELRNYFEEFRDRYNGRYSIYYGFIKDKFKSKMEDEQYAIELIEEKEIESWLKLNQNVSEFDDIFKDCPAQYASNDIPTTSWDKCKTTLADITTSKVHYVKVPNNLIVIDFDIKDESGNKCFKLNLEAASKWPVTYAELSKSGEGIHLHYYYDGDIKKLSRIFGPDIEIKVFNGNSSLRRMLSKCNDLPIAHISSGLPLKEIKSMINEEGIKSEKALRELIKRNLRKEIHPNTKPSMDFIYKILEDAYNSGLKYDVRDMRPAIQTFALSSSHQADYCIRLINKMKFCSEDISENTEKYEEDKPIIFFDIEIFPNLCVVVWKKHHDDHTYVLINPKPEDIEVLCKYRLIGFNNRKYDNHIIYAIMMGYNNKELYELSKRIIDGDKEAFFGEAYNLSYTDIYDFMSSSNKMSLKKWEIKLGIHHQELGYDWNEPIPEDKWIEVGNYCKNDVIATEAVFDAPEIQADWLARQILADLSGLTCNDTTNNCTTRLIVGTDRHPQNEFVYTDLSTIFPGYEFNPYGIDKSKYAKGVKIVSGKSLYWGEDPGEGGYALGNPGMYKDIALLDVASMHPHSAIRLNIFGDRYTKRFEEIVEARVFIKHGEYDKVRGMFDGKIDKWLNDPTIKPKQLANALKTAINSVYGLTSAQFDNKLKDSRNIDNIVAKYGALFMINLKHYVEERGYTVVHIKTDSIKIANADKQIIQEVMDYGKQYGYTFEHEATYDKMCIVNDAVYIAHYANKDWCQNKYGYIPDDVKDHENTWTATGTQFQIPYVFKTLFSHESIVFDDLCETKTVTTAMYLDMNEHIPDLPFDEFGNAMDPNDPRKHEYVFVGRVGSFCPILPGYGGGILLREGINKNGEKVYSAVVGTKKPGKGNESYRWLEAETVKKLGKEDKIDLSYYNHLVDDAIDTISEYGDFERFTSDQNEDLSWMDIPDGVIDGEIPFEDMLINVA